LYARDGTGSPFVRTRRWFRDEASTHPPAALHERHGHPTPTAVEGVSIPVDALLP
jgi:hypothetical protein